MGNAVEIKYYSLSGADELCMLDINASYQNRKTFIKTVESIAKVINIPLTRWRSSDLSDITTCLMQEQIKYQLIPAVQNQN